MFLRVPSVQKIDSNILSYHLEPQSFLTKSKFGDALMAKVLTRACGDEDEDKSAVPRR